MSWDVKFTRGGLEPLGTTAEVQSAILDVIPGVQFSVDPGGDVKIREIESKGVELPEVLRKFFKGRNRTVIGDFRDSAFTMRFFLGSNSEIGYLHVAVNGDCAAAEKVLQRLATSQNWILSDYASRDAKGE